LGGHPNESEKNGRKESFFSSFDYYFHF
jgi:hypothetical protein